MVFTVVDSIENIAKYKINCFTILKIRASQRKAVLGKQAASLRLLRRQPKQNDMITRLKL